MLARMPRTIAATKTDRIMEDAMLAAAGDPERVEALDRARAFKRSWIELAESLTGIYDRRSYEKWGYSTFELYCRKELHLKPSTVQKLLGSFRFLQTNAPRVLERTPEQAAVPVPSVQAVEFVAKAVERGAAGEEELEKIQTAAFDDGVSAPLLKRRFKEIAFPVSDDERRDKLRNQLASTARRLASLVAEPDAPVEHEVAVMVEETLGRLLDALDAAA